MVKGLSFCRSSKYFNWQFLKTDTILGKWKVSRRESLSKSHVFSLFSFAKLARVNSSLISMQYDVNREKVYCSNLDPGRERESKTDTIWSFKIKVLHENILHFVTFTYEFCNSFRSEPDWDGKRTTRNSEYDYKPHSQFFNCSNKGKILKASVFLKYLMAMNIKQILDEVEQNIVICQW